MRRGIDRLRAGGSIGFNPASLFAAGALGLWLDPSDTSTGFQDSAGTTPQTATGQPTGERLDKSGRVNTVLQATSTSRPIYTVAGAISSDVFDAVDDNLSTASFIAGTLGSGMDLFMALNRSSSSNMVPIGFNNSSGEFVGAMDGSAASAVSTAIGTAWSLFVDGVQVGSVNATTRLQLSTAMTSGAWHVMEARDVNLSTLTKVLLSGYSSFQFAGGIGGVIVCPAQSTAIRAQIRTWLGNKVGLSL